MYYHDHISDFEALVNTPETGTQPLHEALTIIASLALALLAISIVFN